MENIKKQETWCPIFTGFYESIFDCSNIAIEYENSIDEDEYKECHPELVKAGVTHEFFINNIWEHANFSECFSNAAESIANVITELDHSEIIKSVEFQKLVRPRYYNFSTDSINVVIEYDEKLLAEYLNENKAEFKKYIESRYTSRDGF